MRWLERLSERGKALAPWRGECVDVDRLDIDRLDIDRFWAEAWRELALRQARLAREMHLERAQWSVDQEAGLIRFERGDGAIVSGHVQIVGAWNPETRAFRWGWDHPSVRTRLRADAERTRWFGERHGLSELTEPALETSEQEAWRLAAAAMKVNAASGVYRGPTEGPIVFMTMRDLQVQ